MRCRHIGILFCAALLLLSACARGETPAPPKAQVTDATLVQTVLPALTPAPMAQRESGVYDPIVTVSTLVRDVPDRAYPQGESLFDNRWTRAYRDRLGVQFVAAWQGEEAALPEAVAAMAASDELPDYMVLPYDSFYALARGGMLEPLDKTLQSQASDEVRAALALYDGAAMRAGTVRGRLFGLTTAPAREADMLWYRQDWLEATGRVQAPSTFEEWIDIAHDFAGDPMRTGQETVGLYVQPRLFAAQAEDMAGLETLFSAYGAYPTQWVQVGEGLQHGSLQGGAMHAALQEMQSLYQEGVLVLLDDKDPYAQLRDALQEGRAGMALAPYWFAEWVQGEGGDTAANARGGLWRPAPMPGLSGASNAAPTAAHQGDVTCIRLGYAYVELPARMVSLTQELLSAPEASLGFRSAIEEGVGKIDTAALALAAGGDRGDDDRGRHAAAVQNALRTGDAAPLGAGERVLYERCLSWQEGKEGAAYGIYAQYGPDGSQAVLADMRARGWLKPDAYAGPKAQSENAQRLKQLRDEAYLAILQGEDVEAGFEKYRQAFYEGGGQAVTDDASAWFAAQ